MACPAGARAPSTSASGVSPTCQVCSASRPRARSAAREDRAVGLRRRRPRPTRSRRRAAASARSRPGARAARSPSWRRPRAGCPARPQRAQRGRAVGVGEEAQRGQQGVEDRRRAGCPAAPAPSPPRSARAGRAATRRRGPRPDARGSRRSRRGSPRFAASARDAVAAPPQLGLQMRRRRLEADQRPEGIEQNGACHVRRRDTGIDAGAWISAGVSILRRDRRSPRSFDRVVPRPRRARGRRAQAGSRARAPPGCASCAAWSTR